MRNVTDEVSNPFGMRPPCPHRCPGSDRRAVFGYGDANADFHVVGDHPGVHGGGRTGVPFADGPAERLLDVLEAVDLIERREGEVVARNCFLSYRYLCCVPEGEAPTPADYRDYEPFFDAELRAIAADVLLPVGASATGHVLEEYTARAHKIPLDMERLHGEQVKGRGFLVMALRDPREWDDGDQREAIQSLRALMAMDYTQMADLGRFLPGGDPYFVR